MTLVGRGYRDDQWFLNRQQALSAVSGPQSRRILIRLVTGSIHVSASKRIFCLLTLMFQGPMKSMWTSNQGRNEGTGWMRAAVLGSCKSNSASEE